MVQDASRCAPEETGGVVLGYWVDDSEAVITEHVGPGPDAQHDITGFVPDAQYQRERIAQIYERTGRTHTYLGDWHSHPLGGLGLSRTDRRTARRIAKATDARCPRPLMLLLACDGGHWRGTVWCRTRRIVGQSAVVAGRLIVSPQSS